MKALFLAPLVVIPGVGDKFLDLVRGIQVHGMDLAQIAIENHARGDEEASGVIHALGRKIAITEEVAKALSFIHI